MPTTQKHFDWAADFSPTPTLHGPPTSTIYCTWMDLRSSAAAPPFLDFSLEFWYPTISAQVVLFNHAKDVHVLLARSDVALLPKIFQPPLSECSGSAPSTCTCIWSLTQKHNLQLGLVPKGGGGGGLEYKKSRGARRLA